MARTGSGEEEEEDDALSTSFEPRRFKLYTRRWFILMVLSVLQCSNAMMWLSYAPIADHTASFYDTNADVVNYLSLVYMVASAIFGAVSAFILDYMGLRAGIIVGAWLNFIGGGLKFLSAFPEVVPPSTSVIVAFLGQSVAALAQPYTMFATTKLAALWFPEQHRALANTIGSMANPLGIMVSGLMSPAIVNPPKGTSGIDLAGYFKTLLGSHCALAGVAAILSVIIITSSKPPTPPSASADETPMPFLASIKKMFRSRAYWLLVVSFGAGIALFTCLSTLLQQILCPYGYNDTFAGMCSAIMIGAGIAGAALTGVIADKTKKFEELAKTFLAFAIVSGCGFAIVARYPNLHALVAFTAGSFGFFGFGVYPIALELGVEVTYPVAEATSSAFIIMSGQVQGIIYLLVLQFMAVNFNPDTSICSKGKNVQVSQAQDFTYSLVFFNAIAFIVCVAFIIFFHANYKRMRAEQEAAAHGIISFNAQEGSNSDTKSSGTEAS